jgi:hypothetical protein
VLRLLRALPVLILCSSVGQAEPIRLIHDGVDHLILELSAPEIKARAVSLGSQSFTELTAPGFTNLGELGAPALPVATRIIAIPQNTRPVVTVISKKETPLPLKDKIVFQGPMRRHCSNDHLKASFDEVKYLASKTRAAVELSEASFIGPVQSAFLSYVPVHFEPKSQNNASIASKMVIRVDFVKTKHRSPKPPVNPQALTDKDFFMYRSLFLNKGFFATLTRQARKSAATLIITPSIYQQALGPLVQFKESTGREVVIKVLDRPTTADVKSVIAAAYQSAMPPSHTVIVGSIDQIPSYRFNGFWTDYTYSLLDAGTLPDISIGRLPARTATELEQLIAKIIHREKTPRNEGSFLVTSGFETDWCQENLGFIMAQIFENSRFALQINKMYASDGFRTAAVVNGFNSNPNVIVYDGHGDERGMTEIPLYFSHFDQLKNHGTYPLIFDIACENTSWPSSGAGSARNFGDSVTVLKEAGAAGIVTSSFFSGGHDLFRHMFRASVYDERDSREPYHDITNMGTIVLWGKIKYLEQYGGDQEALADNYMFYYLGDPESTLFQARN